MDTVLFYHIIKGCQEIKNEGLKKRAKFVILKQEH
jgi:hypothetical protein